MPFPPDQPILADMRMPMIPRYHQRIDPRPRSRAPGLTLVEVLIVIVIIAILAALAFPLVRGMRERAESAQCVQNLRQIGIGLHSYISENNGRFPDGAADVSWAPEITTKRCWYDAAAENMELAVELKLGKPSNCVRNHSYYFPDRVQFYGC